MENFQTAQDYVFSPPASLATSDTEMEDQDQISIRGYGLQRMRRQYLNVQANAPSKRLFPLPPSIVNVLTAHSEGVDVLLRVR